MGKVLKHNNNVTVNSAFDALYTKYWEPLFLYACKISGSKELSQDIVQEVFFSLWQHQHISDIKNIEGYLFQSVKYQVFKSYRDKRFDTLQLNEDFEAYLIDQIEGDTNEEVSNSILLKLLDGLPEKRKEIVYLNKFQGLSVSEIAKELDISSQTVKNQLHRALKHLKTSLKEVYFFFF
ncbi:RNA polymerase sigma-70 factor [Zhouia spongiae]|uniref:RNA polymerase sigma-70 factor n=1 Tax=Zhouia spongiae TaxID=2202721 RepID=A0ABY3YQ09_9FLAO|nr:RNA polymerase sigma-70 factor [Zhouia spongiae]UNY99788.1 RNA polymerase sigma-70 factor [Zhouia spongiae]